MTTARYDFSHTVSKGKADKKNYQNADQFLRPDSIFDTGSTSLSTGKLVSGINERNRKEKDKSQQQKSD
jgi:hypothetical protein